MNNTVNKLILDRGSREKLHKKLRFATRFSNSRNKYIVPYLFKIMFPQVSGNINTSEQPVKSQTSDQIH